MNSENNILSYGDKLGVSLCNTYRSYGYQQYKMSKFEEYDLYARNKDFLISDAVLTFTDLSGKLMALKPDVTLSIVRNSRDDSDSVQKVYYTENVYRVSRGGRSFQEILQAGLECIGTIDAYHISEVLMLAAESLKTISERSVLEISNLDILAEIIDCMELSSEYRSKILKCISEKNLHELTLLCDRCGADKKHTEKLVRLLNISGMPDAVLPELEALCGDGAAVAQLKEICSDLISCGYKDLLRIDFSLVNDMNYYNGIVFRGFVHGVPTGVVSGGQYDRLMEKMGRKSGAIGFAVYLDALERLGNSVPEFDVDILLLYDVQTNVSEICTAVRNLAEQGYTVSANSTRPEKLKYRQVAKMNGSEVIFINGNA